MLLTEIRDNILKNLLAENKKYAEWSCQPDEVSAYGIGSQFKNEIAKYVNPSIAKNLRISNNRKHITVCFDVYAGHKNVTFDICYIEIKTKRGKYHTGYFGGGSYDWYVKDLEICQFDSGRNLSIEDFCNELYNNAVNFTASAKDYKAKAAEVLNTISDKTGITNWTELNELVRYIHSNFSDLYNEAAINAKKI